MKLIDADALRDAIGDGTTWRGSSWKQLKEEVVTALDAAPSISCAADNPHGLVPSKCPTCGEGLVPAPCMDLAQDSYRDGILYGQEHAEWRADG